MNFVTAIKEICKSDPDSFRFRSDYSGRGMGGATCVGVVCHSHTALFSAFLTQVQEQGSEDLDLSDAIEAFESARQDSMGRDVILYFPGWKASDDDSSPDSDESSDEGES